MCTIRPQLWKATATVAGLLWMAREPCQVPPADALWKRNEPCGAKLLELRWGWVLWWTGLVSGSVTAAAAVGLAVDLVRTDSVNPGLVPGAAGEGAVAGLLARRLERGGFDAAIVPAPGAPGRPSVVARHAGTGGGRSLLLNGHLDTVGVAGMASPFAGRVVGGRVRGRLLGRGACDMKAGVAAMVAAAEAAAAAGTAGDIVLALVADEEHASVGTEAVLDFLGGRLPDACLVPVAGPGSMMTTVAGGGTSPFVLADAAFAVVERRTVPGEAAAGALAEVESILSALRAGDPSVQAEASLMLSREAWEFDPAAPAGAALSGMLAAALGARLGHVPGQIGAPYWMESALWQAAGVPTVVCGPAGGGMHAEDEWVGLPQVRAYADALVDTIGAFCGPAAA